MQCRPLELDLKKTYLIAGGQNRYLVNNGLKNSYGNRNSKATVFISLLMHNCHNRQIPCLIPLTNIRVPGVSRIKVPTRLEDLYRCVIVILDSMYQPVLRKLKLNSVDLIENLTNNKEPIIIDVIPTFSSYSVFDNQKY